MRIMSYHHKGGVGKTTTAVHVALRLLSRGRRVLVVDGDSQAHACRFFGVDGATAEDGPVAVPAAGALHAEHKRIRQQPKAVGAQDVVIDLSADLGGASPAALSLEPDLVLVCVKSHAGALWDLDRTVNALLQETEADVRVVPIGVPEADIHAALAALPAGAYSVAPPVSYVPDEAEQAFVERRPIWTIPGRDGMAAQYDALIA